MLKRYRVLIFILTLVVQGILAYYYMLKSHCNYLDVIYTELILPGQYSIIERLISYLFFLLVQINIMLPIITHRKFEHLIRIRLFCSKKEYIIFIKNTIKYIGIFLLAIFLVMSITLIFQKTPIYWNKYILIYATMLLYCFCTAVVVEGLMRITSDNTTFFITNIAFLIIQSMPRLSLFDDETMLLLGSGIYILLACAICSKRILKQQEVLE